MSATEPAAPRLPWHPLPLGFFVLFAVRALGLLLHFFSTDPNGSPVAASPMNLLIIAVPYHETVLLGAAAFVLALWKLLRPARPWVTAGGLAFVLAAVALGQVDLGLQWFIGQRFSPAVAGTYLGPHLLTDDLVRPLLAHPVHLATGLALMAVPWAVLGRALWRHRRAGAVREPDWRLIGTLAALAALCAGPVRLAYGHQRDVLRPPELLFAYHWLLPGNTPRAADAAAAVAQLRAAVDPDGTSRWLDPRFPLVRAAPTARNRFLDAPPAEPPDILIFAVESLRGADVGYLPGNYPAGGSPTPNLDRLAQRSVVFSRFISNGNPSPRGFIALNTGNWDHRGSFIASGFTSTELDALPLRLRDRGYFTLGLWGTNPSFDNQLFWAKRWFDRLSYDLPENRLFYLRRLGDDVLMDRLMAALAEHDRAAPRQPVFAYIATAGTHEPYSLDGHTGLPAARIAAVAAERDPRKRYRLVLQTFDEQLGRVLDFLAARRTGRGLLVIVTGDHADVAGERQSPELRGAPDDAYVWTSALVYGPPAWIGPVPRIETFTASQVDVMPTVLDLVGDRRPTVSTGMNLFADVPAGRRSAVAVRGHTLRLDRDGWSLFVDRDRPEEWWAMPACTPGATPRRDLDGSPFAPDDPRRFWDNLNLWSRLLETDRVWRPSFLTEDASIPSAPDYSR